MAIDRRSFIKAGALGTAALVTAGAYEAWRLRDCQGATAALPPEGRALFAAVLPAFLDGMVEPAAWTPALMNTTLDGVERTIQGLGPNAIAELRQLFCLLDQRPLRFALTGVWASWPAVDAVTARRFLDRWRNGNTAMLTSAYQALHDISFGAWYAAPSSWPAIGYPGPPRLTGSAA